MNTRPVYKTKSDFEEGLANGKLYEGFVIGEGYAYINYLYQYPAVFNGSADVRDSSLSDYCFTGFRKQEIDRSAEMIELSLRAHMSGEYAEYTVKRNDTLTSISRDLCVTVDELVVWNNIKDPNRIDAGQILLYDTNRSRERLIEELEWRRKMLQSTHEIKNSIRMDEEQSNYLAGVMGFVEYGSLISSAIGGLKYTKNIPGTGIGGFWRGANGNYYNMAEALPSSGRGWNFRANSSNIAKGVSVFKYLRWGGNAFGVFSTGYSGVQFVEDPNWEDGLDTGFGIGGLIY
ncbi:MAG: LysM peptidoglycan-binding domain-containing protein [Bacteroides sp.]|nr:LysM peptidoglycan-binding domain-containing protein [Bacteroides sp.]